MYKNYFAKIRILLPNCAVNCDGETEDENGGMEAVFAKSMYTNTNANTNTNTNTKANINTNTMRVACFCKVWSASHVYEAGAAGKHRMPLVCNNQLTFSDCLF